MLCPLGHNDRGEACVCPVQTQCFLIIFKAQVIESRDVGTMRTKRLPAGMSGFFYV